MISLQKGIIILLEKIILIMKGEGSIYRLRGRGMDGYDAWMKAYEGLGCPKGKYMNCASLEPIKR